MAMTVVSCLHGLPHPGLSPGTRLWSGSIHSADMRPAMPASPMERSSCSEEARACHNWGPLGAASAW